MPTFIVFSVRSSYCTVLYEPSVGVSWHCSGVLLFGCVLIESLRLYSASVATF